MSTAVQSRKRFTPGYRSLLESGELACRVERALQRLGECALCPRDCHVDRLSDKSAVCRTGRHARVSSFFAHFGEEDCLRGTRGSGTIFFSGCNLRCVFCQNFEISCQAEGEETSPEQLAGMMLALQERGCHNINLVTPEHVVPQILEALLIAARNGLRLPLVYNTGAYDSLALSGGALGLTTVLLTRDPEIELGAGASVEMVLERSLTIEQNKVNRAGQ